MHPKAGTLTYSQQPQNRSQWARNKSYQGPQKAKNPPSKPLQEKPQVPVSTATKNKLSNFQFTGQKPDLKEPIIISLLSDDDKENSEASFGTLNKSSPRKDSPEKAKTPTHEQPSLPEPPKRDVPRTPANRLALPELIGMSDVQRAVQKNVSPEDRIEWKHDDDSPPMTTPFRLRRAKKRARSSSPPASSPAPPYFRNDNLQVDPGSELWGRYSLNGANSTTPQDHTVPALAHIMENSSPQPSRNGNTPRGVAGFRRANSCGTQFPKRRKIGASDGDVFTEPVNIGPSKLSVLIERVQESMSQPRDPFCESKSPKRSSPSRASYKKGILIVDRNSPKLQKEGRGSSSYKEHQKEVVAEEIYQREESVKPESDYGDEFDDDDLDAGLLETLESQSFQKTSNIQPKSLYVRPGPPPQPPSLPKKSASTPKPEHVTPSNKRKAEADDFGDFDEFDDDDFGDLEQVVSQFDRRSPVKKLQLPSVSRNQKAAPQVSNADSDDEFGDGDLDVDDFEAAVAATQSIPKSARGLIPTTRKVQAIQRYLVNAITLSKYQNAKERWCDEKILFLEVENTKTTVFVNLRGDWQHTPVTVKAYVHVIGSFHKSQCIIDDEKNMLILHPDHLVSATVVADSFGCTRRAVLQDRVKATGDAAPPMVYGTLLHEIFQQALVANRWDSEWLEEVIESVATMHVEDLYTIKIQIPHAIEYLKSKMPELQAWAELFVSSQPKPEATVQAGNGETASMCVSKLLDVEEHVWSPMYGLKGNIDATVQVTMQDGNKQRTLTVPFEVKTGKNPSASHRAQTALYNLLLCDRYDMEVAYGILYYMETSETIRIPKIQHELRHMIMQRNELACFVRERDAQLPPMLKKEHMCGRCYAKVPCFIYHKLADDGNGETSGMKDKFDEVAKHLTPKHKEFFLKWDDLLTKEEKESLKFRRELWTMLSSEREKLGRCFSNVVVQPGSGYEELGNAKINRYNYTLMKPEVSADFSFLASQIIVGEPIVISDEKGHFALANGYVTKVQKDRITVAVDRRLHNARIRQVGFDETNNQVFTSIMQVGVSPTQLMEGKSEEEPIRYRLDKDEFSNGIATVRNNLIQVMADGPIGSRHIRGLVVDLNAPRFKNKSTAYTLKEGDAINGDQRKAIEKVMSAEDYALVLGMPGTGKTTTIAHIIRALVLQGKSVLLTSYTHTAVDNILLKLKDDHMGILRLGTSAKVHPDVREFSTLAATPKKTFDEIKSAWHDAPIVATTCLGINHAIFTERTFDYCIVDEASQITLPVCLGPIRLAKTFILVGDHNQLPPLVQNEEARLGGLDISLFKHLSDTHPSSVVYLEHQYRMCEDVMALSNNLIYNGRLKCGSNTVAQRQLTIPNLTDGLKAHHFTPATLSHTQKSFCRSANTNSCWLRQMLDPRAKVRFLNTDPLLPASREQARGNRIVNQTEASLCTQLVEALLTVGVPAESIGVMTHYRSQLALLKDSLRHHKDVEMHTADRFQGRDKEVIILSLVRSNEAGSIGELLKDWRRVNVALTRAKTKLLVVGSRETLSGRGGGEEEMIHRFVGLMDGWGWIFDVPPEAMTEHYFEVGATQVSGTACSRVGATQLRSLEQGGMKRKVGGGGLGEDGENENGRACGKRVPRKSVVGMKPYKMPMQGVLRDIVNDAVG
ncbi:hypothetical protein HYALB_00007712 [Hymenoscyphus albidus]|uniref:DNA replication ATP-dependent helicase/nuclease n=1 Tax=Hymenoscyphus albidus TaxID=595503 RepID=A0A9N9LHQ3_9HELO|nr:hypothetical protein HYALB_00007712 [Hymenoscyphus albidus]